MTKVVEAGAYGGPDVLTVVAVDLGHPDAGEVLVEVRAAGTNPIDFKRFSGTMGTDPAKLPMRLGFEASGVVVEVGADAHGPGGAIRPGDEVIVYQASGCYAEALLAPGDAVLPKPSSLTFEQAGGLMLVGVTAVHALAATGVGPGDTVVIHGLGGGVGLMALQLARNAGARVLGSASPSRHDALRRLGAEPVAYGDGLEERLRALAPDGVDAAIDTVGTDEALDVSVALVADRQRIATIAGFSRGAELGVKLLGGGPGADSGAVLREQARMELIRQAEAKRLEVIVAATYPLADAADALRALQSGHTFGKIILVP